MRVGRYSAQLIWLKLSCLFICCTRIEAKDRSVLLCPFALKKWIVAHLTGHRRERWSKTCAIMGTHEWEVTMYSEQQMCVRRNTVLSRAEKKMCFANVFGHDAHEWYFCQPDIFEVLVCQDFSIKNPWYTTKLFAYRLPLNIASGTSIFFTARSSIRSKSTTKHNFSLLKYF